MTRCKKMVPFKRLNRGGFSLVEVLIAVSVIGILSASAVPLIGTQIEKARRSRAASEVSSIKDAFVRLIEDTRQKPIGTTVNPIAVLESGGTRPPNGDPAGNFLGQMANGSTAQDMSFHLEVNNGNFYDGRNSEKNGWQGPYLQTNLLGDPWGMRYQVNVQGFRDSGPVWVLSAAEDQIVQQVVTATTINAADIGQRLN